MSDFCDNPECVGQDLCVTHLARRELWRACLDLEHYPFPCEWDELDEPESFETFAEFYPTWLTQDYRIVDPT